MTIHDPLGLCPEPQQYLPIRGLKIATAHRSDDGQIPHIGTTKRTYESESLTEESVDFVFKLSLGCPRT